MDPSRLINERRGDYARRPGEHYTLITLDRVGGNRYGSLVYVIRSLLFFHGDDGGDLLRLRTHTRRLPTCLLLQKPPPQFTHTTRTPVLFTHLRACSSVSSVFLLYSLSVSASLLSSMYTILGTSLLQCGLNTSAPSPTCQRACEVTS